MYLFLRVSEVLIIILVVTFSVTEDTPAVIVLSRLDERSFLELSGCSFWSMDFNVYRQGESIDNYSKPLF